MSKDIGLEPSGRFLGQRTGQSLDSSELEWRFQGRENYETEDHVG
jgi:hypothetical protein